MEKNILILGATGFIGQALVKRLEDRGDKVWALVRNPDHARIILGKKTRLVISNEELEEVPLEAVVNLAGAPIMDEPWDENRKALLINSRVGLTEDLAQWTMSLKVKPLVWVQGSAVGFYRFTEEAQDEDSPVSETFLGQLCQAWEKAALRAEAWGIRVCLARTGMVLGSGGGALKKMVPPFQYFVGGPLGNGRQWMPWIHLEDEVSAMVMMIDNPQMRGPYNLVSPEQVTNGQFSKALGKALGRPALLPAPAFVLQLVLGDRAHMILAPQRIVPRRLEEAGFEFQYPQLNGALSQLFQKA